MGIRAANRDYERWLARPAARRNRRSRPRQRSTRRCAKAPSPSCAPLIGAGPKRSWRSAPISPTRRPVLAVGDIASGKFRHLDATTEGRIDLGRQRLRRIRRDALHPRSGAAWPTSAALATTPSADFAQGDLQQPAVRLRARHRGAGSLRARPQPHVAAHALRRGRGRSRHILAKNRETVSRPVGEKECRAARRRAGSRCSPRRCRSPRSTLDLLAAHRGHRQPRPPALARLRQPGAAGRCCARARRW